MAAELMTDTFSRNLLNARRTLSILEGEVTSSGSSHLQELVRELASHLDNVNEKLDLMVPLYRPDNRNSQFIDITRVIADTAFILQDRLEETSTRFQTAIAGSFEVKMNEGHLMQVLLILVENALNVMEEAKVSEPVIEFRTFVEGNRKILKVTDNGPGVPTHLQNLIFQPYFSARQSGRGLGLHVARDILQLYNYSLSIKQNESVLPGASFEINFK
jgi:C4-dicarboxylate-specific signal transduction histidine kinase